MRPTSIIYGSVPNLVVRTALRPFASFLSERYLFPVTGKISVRPPGKKPFVVNCNPTSHLTKKIFWGGCQAFEPELLPVFQRFSQTKGIFVDVGANIGYYSLLASAYNPALIVLAFEPSPTPFRHLVKNLKLNGRSTVTPVPVALSDHNGSIDFYAARNPKYPQFDQIGGTGSGLADHASVHGASDRVKAHAQKLDTYWTENNIGDSVGLIKIDVEGAELSVIEGATSLIERDRPVVIFESLARAQDRIETFNFFSERGYVVHLATLGGLTDAITAPESGAQMTNYVAIPKRG